MFRKMMLLTLGLALSPAASAQDASAFREQVQTMYVAYYGRPGDEGGVAYWADRLAQAHPSVDEIVAAFGNSEEFQQRFGDLDSEELVNNIYLQLLGRDADAGGLGFYVGELEAGRLTLASIALDVANGALNSDIDVIANKLAVAAEFTVAYVAANVSYGSNEIVYAKQLIDAVDSTAASVQAALDSLDDTLGQFPAVDAIRVRLATNFGDIVVQMYSEEAPVTVQNFLDYVDSDFYSDLWFHRIVAGFVIQGGGFFQNPENPQQLLQKATNPPIVNEASNGLSNVRGSVAMARTNDPDSATAQFFINLVDNTPGNPNNLDPGNGSAGYAVFARVVSGMTVVDAIAAVPTFSNSVPTTEVVILSATRLEP